MSHCVNEKCHHDPQDSLDMVVVTIDGDMACCPACKREYENQRDHFLNDVLPDDQKYKEWIDER